MTWAERLQPLTRRLAIAVGLMRRATTLGVRGVVRRHDGAVLLVRHTYLGGWYLPGGGVDLGETVAAAFAREVVEETGVRLAGPPRLVSFHHNPAVSRRDHVAFFVAEAEESELGPSPSPWEIAETGFFTLDDLPATATAGTRRRLAELYDGVPESAEW
ncbi:NUDIX domain-containing protein [Siculibacillus lacustris]|uniref:NUDIX domain-containing protein n=1 Tax=Siculibacillus lacustris TaxID=1549641 RepID=A0A4Q9VQ83_9HYPH|nr:NUDIX domain-containing protein [Siculibacillus lacustris]TBW37420.1 NUDIX domain-containing protein [Siculibacillus lacustris]